MGQGFEREIWMWSGIKAMWNIFKLTIFGK